MNWIKNNIWLLASLVVAILAGRMLLTSHHFYVHDDIQVFRVNEFISCVKEWQIPCRWSANLGKGYGMPWFNYYPPMIYIIPSLIHLTGLSIITSLNLFMFLTFLLSAWGMYLLVQELTRRGDLAFFGSVLFTLYPFHATNVFLRGVYGENLAWSLTPLILYYLYRQIKQHKFSLTLPILLVFVFLTHIISSFLVLGISFVWILILLWSTPSQLAKNIQYLLVAVLVALGISAFFFIPALAEKGLVQSDTLILGYYSYLNHFVSLKQLFLDYTWNYGASYWGQPKEEMGYMVGHLHILALIITSILAFATHRKTKSLTTPTLLVFLAGLILFFAHSQSAFIWRLIPPLAYVQFPWRFIGWAGIPLVISISLFMSAIPQKLSHYLIILLSLALFIYSYPFFFPRSYDTYTDVDFLTGSLKYEQETKALFDYLPLTVRQVPEAFADQSKASIPVFYFPGWSANVAISPDSVSGLIKPVAGESESIQLNWGETPFRLSMDILSVLTIIGYGYYAFKSHVQ